MRAALHFFHWKHRLDCKNASPSLSSPFFSWYLFWKFKESQGFFFGGEDYSCSFDKAELIFLALNYKIASFVNIVNKEKV